MTTAMDDAEGWVPQATAAALDALGAIAAGGPLPGPRWGLDVAAHDAVRAATPPQGGAHAHKPRSSVKTSSYRGVAATDNGSWRARIRYGKYTIHLGRFRHERDAALSYDRAAAMLLGPTAVLNFREKCRDADAVARTAAIIHSVLGADAPQNIVKLAGAFDGAAAQSNGTTAAAAATAASARNDSSSGNGNGGHNTRRGGSGGAAAAAAAGRAPDTRVLPAAVYHEQRRAEEEHFRALALQQQLGEANDQQSVFDQAVAQAAADGTDCQGRLPISEEDLQAELLRQLQLQQQQIQVLSACVVAGQPSPLPQPAGGLDGLVPQLQAVLPLAVPLPYVTAAALGAVPPPQLQPLPQPVPAPVQPAPVAHPPPTQSPDTKVTAEALIDRILSDYAVARGIMLPAAPPAPTAPAVSAPPPCTAGNALLAAAAAAGAVPLLVASMPEGSSCGGGSGADVAGLDDDLDDLDPDNAALVMAISQIERLLQSAPDLLLACLSAAPQLWAAPLSQDAAEAHAGAVAAVAALVAQRKRAPTADEGAPEEPPVQRRRTSAAGDCVEA